MTATVLWFTGLSGAGKTTIASGVSKILIDQNYSVKIIDGDDIRDSIHTKLGFTPEDISTNNEQIAIMCLSMLADFNYIFVPIISPFKDSRAQASKILGHTFTEVYVKSDITTLIERDTKGLYKKALNNQLANMIGIDPLVPYEPPNSPDIVLNTKEETKANSIRKLLIYLGK